LGLKMKCVRIWPWNIPLSPKLTVISVIVNITAILVALKVNIDLIVFLVSIIALALTLVPLFVLKANYVTNKIDIEAWCQELESDFYRENKCKIVYLENVKRHFKKWLSNQTAFPDHSKRKVVFISFVDIEKGITPLENIREGLKKYFNKPWYQRAYEVITNKSSGLG